MLVHDDETAGLQFTPLSTGVNTPMEEEFEETSGVRFMHGLPRFGHGSDFAKLASADQEEQTDYVVGVLAVSYFIISIFLFWLITILTCKYMGKNRVGLCAGQTRVVSDSKGQFHIPSYIWQLRITFMVFGILMILLNVGLVGPGLSSISNTSISTRKLNRNVRDLITQGLLIMDQVKRVKWNLNDLDVNSILNIEESCPNLENNTFISDKSIRQSLNGIDKEFEQLQVYLEMSDLESIYGHVDYLVEGTETIDNAMTTIEKNDWIVRMFALILSVLSFFMIFASCASLVGKCFYLPALKCMTMVFILPMFIVGIIGSWIATSALAFASVSNADFCTGNSEQSGPAGTVMGIFEERGITSEDIIYVAFQYFQSGCVTEDPINDIYKYEDDLQVGIGHVTKFLDKTDEIGIDEINAQCGADVSSIIEGVGQIKDNLGILLGALRSTFELASCYKMRPVYIQAFEGTACTDSSGSLTLIFSILIAISFVGMIMITLRAAMYPYKKVHLSSSLDDEEDEWEEYQAYLRYMAGFVTMWGGEKEDKNEKMYDTASESTPSNNIHLGLGNSSSLSSDAADGSPRVVELYEDEERMPLSPPNADFSAADRSRIYTPSSQQDSADYDERAALSPETPTIHVNEIKSTRRRFRTPEFLSPGTFRSWRTNDEEQGDPNNRELPQTPLMTSPRNQETGRSQYFSSIISPMRIDDKENGSSGKID